MTLLPTMTSNIDNTKGLKAVLPYWPVIAFCIMCLTSLGGILAQLNYIAKAIDKTELQFTAIGGQITIMNDRQNAATQAIVEIRSINDRQTMDIARTEKNIAELNHKVEAINRDRRWAPK